MTAAPPTKAAIPHYLKRTESHDKGIRSAALRHLCQFGTEGALPPGQMAKVVEQIDPYALHPLLSQFAAKAKREHAIVYLAAVMRTRGSGRPALRFAAKYFITFPDPRAVEPLMQHIVSDESWSDDSAVAVAKAIEKCATDLKPIREKLTAGLSNKFANCRYKCATALRILGDKSAVPALAVAARRNRDDRERALCDEAIREIVCPAADTTKKSPPASSWGGESSGAASARARSSSA